MKTATQTSKSLILAATIALAALVTPTTAAAGSDELTVTERGHSFKVGDVVFFDEDAGTHIAVPISYLMGEVRESENKLLLVTSVAQDGFRASPVESHEDGDVNDADVAPRIVESKAAVDKTASPVVSSPQPASDDDTVVLVIKHADAEALRTALVAVLGKDATVTVGRAGARRDVLAMTN